MRLNTLIRQFLHLGGSETTRAWALSSGQVPSAVLRLLDEKVVRIA